MTEGRTAPGGPTVQRMLVGAQLRRLRTEMGLSREEAGEAHLFRVDVHEVVHTRVGDPADHLVIELWQQGRGVRRLRRR